MLAGSNPLESDAIELPSMFFERWLELDATTLRGLTHYATGAAMPGKLVNALVAQRRFK